MRIRTFTPNIVESILDDTLPDHLTLFDIAVDPPALWEEQYAARLAASPRIKFAKSNSTSNSSPSSNNSASIDATQRSAQGVTGNHIC